MTQIKKFAWSGTLVALAMLVAMTTLVSTAYAASPSIISVTPNAGPTVGDTVVTIKGTNFTNPPVHTVTFGGDDALSFVINNKTTITAVTPPNPAGAVNVVVTNSNGSATLVNGFTYGGVVSTATETILTVDPTTVPADGSLAAEVSAIVFVNGALAVGRQVTFSASVGGFGVAGTTSVVAFTDAFGEAVVLYRGTGTTGSDQIVATTPAPNAAVATANVTVSGAAAGTPSQVVFVNTWITAASGPNGGVIAASNSSANPSYTTPNVGTNVVFRVTDAGGVGVGNQVLQVSTDKGALVAYDASCTGAAKTITVQSAVGTAFGGTSTTGPGRAAVRLCALSSAANLGQATITAKNITTTMPVVTANVTIAGVPATIATTATGGALVVNVTDANGNPVADGTEVMVTIASPVGTVAPASRTTIAGKASFAVALTGTSGNAIVSVNDLVSGTLRLTQSVSLTGGTTPPATGPGTFAAPPTFGTGTVGSAVFNGGTLAQLAAAVTAAGGSSVWAQDANGIWRVHVVGAAAFVNSSFNTAFASGFAGPTAVFVVK